MEKKNNSERGQALVIIALAIIGLVGLTGLAIDGSIALADRREAQHAADSAALAGALAYIQECGTTGCDSAEEISNAKDVMALEALDRAGSNGYGGDLIRSQVDIYTCDEVSATCETPYIGNPDYIQVVITSHVETSLAQAVGIPVIHNRVEAIALADDDDTGPLFAGNAIVALAPSGNGCSGEFVLGGSGTVTVTGGGMFINSDNTADDLSSTTCGAFKQDGCNTTLDFVDGGGITSVGNINLNPGCSGNLEGPMVEGADPVAFPPDIEIPAPGECSATPAAPTVVTLNNILRLHPGNYAEFPPNGNFMGINMNKYPTLVLDSGTYCVSDFKESSKSVTGTDVFVYIKPGGVFDLTGGVMTLDAPNAGPYKSYLIYVAPPASGFKNCTLTGNSSAQLTGTIFAPFCNVTVNGSSSPDGIHAQIIGYTIKLTGDNALYIEYDPGENAEEVLPPQIGLAH